MYKKLPSMNKYILFTGMLLCTAIAQAQQQFHSLQDILNYADKHAVSIKNAQLQQQVSQSKQKEANAFLYPSINGSAGFTDNITIQPTLVPEQLFNPSAPDGSFKEMTFGKQYVYSAGIQAQWNLLDFQKMVAQKTASWQTATDRANAVVTRFNTYNQLASTYYSVLLSRYSLQLYEKNLATTAAMLASAEEKYKKGIISEQEHNQVAIEHLQNERNVATTRQNLEVYVKQLQIQLNSNDSIVIATDSLETAQYAVPANPETWTLHPEVSVQKAAVERSKSSLKETKALHYPSLSVTYQYNYNWATNTFMDLSGANNLPQQYVGLKLNVPLFNGFVTKQKIVQSGLQLQQQELQLQNLQQSKAKEDEILLLQYAQTNTQLRRNKEILALQGNNDFHTGKQYQSGIISLDARMDKYRDLLTAQNAWLQSLADHMLTQYKIYIRQINYQ